MNDSSSAYGLWGLVLINSVIFIFFAFTFFKPQTPRDWRSFGAFSAFLVALFAEMYGFPLTFYFLSGWLQTRYPNVDWLSHDAGHLLEMMFGWKANPHFGPFHILSNVLIIAGFLVISASWRVLYEAQRNRVFGDNWSLLLRPPSSICRLHSGDARLPVAVANAAHTCDVPGSGLDVRPARALGGAGRHRRIWRGLQAVRALRPRILSAMEQTVGYFLCNGDNRWLTNTNRRSSGNSK